MQRIELHVLGHRPADVRQALGEEHELVVLRLLLARPILGVVQVLPTPRRVGPGRLQLRARIRRDPDVFPRGRYDERLDALELSSSVIRSPRESTYRKPPSRPGPRPASSTCHEPEYDPKEPSTIRRRWIRAQSSSSKGTRPGRSCSRRRCASLAPDVVGIELEFPRYDLSLERRRETAERRRLRGGGGGPRAWSGAESGDGDAGDA